MKPVRQFKNGLFYSLQPGWEVPYGQTICRLDRRSGEMLTFSIFEAGKAYVGQLEVPVLTIEEGAGCVEVARIGNGTVRADRWSAGIAVTGCSDGLQRLYVSPMK